MTSDQYEPLQIFDESTGKYPHLHELDEHAGKFRELQSSGGIAAGTLEALRIELTYHSNAIEGNTLTLRDTQLVIEGKAPAGEKDFAKSTKHETTTVPCG